MVANRVCDESKVQESEQFEQLDLFTDYQERAKEKQKEDEVFSRERKLQEAMISVKKKYGKNAMLKGMNLEEVMIIFQGTMRLEDTRHSITMWFILFFLMV